LLLAAAAPRFWPNDARPPRKNPQLIVSASPPTGATNNARCLCLCLQGAPANRARRAGKYLLLGRYNPGRPRTEPPALASPPRLPRTRTRRPAPAGLVHSNDLTLTDGKWPPMSSPGGTSGSLPVGEIQPPCWLLRFEVLLSPSDCRNQSLNITGSLAEARTAPCVVDTPRHPNTRPQEHSAAVAAAVTRRRGRLATHRHLTSRASVLIEAPAAALLPSNPRAHCR